MILTEEQQNIINISGVLESGQSLKIDACAGSGKTATLSAIANAYRDRRFLYLAFNKAIVESAKNRFPQNVAIYTTHSLAFRSIFQIQNPPYIKPSLNVFDLEPVFGKVKYNYREISDHLNKFIAFCNSDLKTYPNSSIATLFEAMDKGIIPMCHEFYLKKYQMQKTHPDLDRYDYILLDEAQDTNLVTMDIFRSNNARKILVGDSHQSIYGFRGAYNALLNFKADYEEHLTYTFRSNEEICKRANFFIKTFAADKDNYLPMKTYGEIKENPEPKNAVITRTNSGLITYLLKLTNEQKQRATLIREPDMIFRPALNILKFINGDSDFDKEYAYLKRFTSLDKLKDYVHDSMDLELDTAIRIAEDQRHKLYNLYKEAQRLYQNRNNDNINIYFTTAHTAKGLEWDQVLLADDFCDLLSLKKLYKKRGLKKKVIEYLFNQEVNLIYVAITRARTLIIDRSENNITYLNLDGKAANNTKKTSKNKKTAKRKPKEN